MTDDEKLEMINSAYDVCYHNVSSFYQDSVGVELAYITQAILSGQKCELLPGSELVRLLVAELHHNHPIWNHIIVERTVYCVNCETEIFLDNASFSPPLNGWLGYNCCANHIPHTEEYYEEITLVK